MDEDKLIPFKRRLKEALNERGMRPADLVRMTGISRSNISQYLSGVAEPRRDRLEIMAKALNVSLLWFLGANVPMDSKAKKKKDFATVYVETEIHCKNLDETLQKLERLQELLKEANSLVDELASKEVEVTISM